VILRFQDRLYQKIFWLLQYMRISQYRCEEKEWSQELPKGERICNYIIDHWLVRKSEKKLPVTYYSEVRLIKTLHTKTCLVLYHTAHSSMSCPSMTPAWNVMLRSQIQSHYSLGSRRPTHVDARNILWWGTANSHTSHQNVCNFVSHRPFVYVMPVDALCLECDAESTDSVPLQSR
jgi:hypothetical protein